eukprot:Sspe_Gene.112738::Locus_95999_Transcript_1_1_Confidence_1.000_Length_741::g.112738::m.112738
MYPMCEKCSVEDHCNNRASSVRVEGDKCTCTCSHMWKGDRCESCPPNYSATCDSCATGHIAYPECTQCTVAKHCSNHATTVVTDAAKTACQCACRNGWSGKDCSICDARFVQGGDCDTCEAGRILFPTCRSCDNDDDCNGQAERVDSNAERTECTCTCREGYTGGRCEQCEEGYVRKEVASRFFCSKCTNENNCNKRASSVTSNDDHSECKCTCNNKWTGSDCSVCNAIYDQATCASCAAGRYGFP